MCGIAVILRTDQAPVKASTIQAMTAALSHRGPDEQGVHCEESVALGHCRLSIIDLETGAQPLSNEDGNVWVTFNGEIYNYRELRTELIGYGHTFRTSSDTEVLVHGYEQWGCDFVARLRGMFAFVLWDGRRRRFFLARDRVGMKPLFYLEQPGLFAVASELQAFQALEEFQPTLDVQAIDMYLHYQYIPAPLTIYKETRKLPPAHYLVVNADGTHGAPVRYWDVVFRPDRSCDEDEWIERIDAALRETVSVHLVSDVPFGAFLSGGIDSSSILAYMSELLPEPVRAFTIGHRAADYDERRWAEEAAQVCGAEHHVKVIEPDALELLPTLVQHYGEPFGDSSAVATWHVSQLARRQVKMVLSGDGGDELFAGYHAYAAVLWEHEPALSTARHVRHALANGARAAGLWPRRPSIADQKFERTAVIEPRLRRRLWKPEWADLVDGTRAQFEEQLASSDGEDLLGRLQRFDLLNYIAYDNLTKVDVASMCHGLEVRVPMLDHVFIETAAQVPPELKLRPATGSRAARNGRLVPGAPLVGKYILKRNGRRFFSDEFLHRKKGGFEVPIQKWFAEPYREELRSRLAGPSSLLRDFFDEECLSDVVESGAASRRGAWKAWSLLVLAEWLSQSRPQRHRMRPDSRAALPCQSA